MVSIAATLIAVAVIMIVAALIAAPTFWHSQYDCGCVIAAASNAAATIAAQWNSGRCLPFAQDAPAGTWLWHSPITNK